ncbi:MAG: YXWGXW repeat-containing protein [Verrucomicrobiota bacterium]|nr:YXWGXW repeat-containing protein [Verrucomicrobiota bacterium]
MKTTTLVKSLFQAAALLPFAGCVVRERTVKVAQPAPPGGEVVLSQPVAAPPQPNITFVWVPGAWEWRGRQWIWIPGRWTPPPRRGAVWVRGHWEHHGRGYVWRDGHWRR